MYKFRIIYNNYFLSIIFINFLNIFTLFELFKTKIIFYFIIYKKLTIIYLDIYLIDK